jgi:hypothetical protein
VLLSGSETFFLIFKCNLDGNFFIFSEVIASSNRSVSSPLRRFDMC